MSRAASVVTHLRSRALDSATLPGALATVVLFAVAAVVFGPRVTPGLMPDRLDLVFPGAAGAATWALWLYLWPALPVVAVTGRATGRRGASADPATPMPALPIGVRGRALAETAVVAAALAAVGLVAVATGVTAPAGAAAVAIALAHLAPTTLAWALPARSLDWRLYRALAVAAVLGGARTVGLFDRHAVGLVVVSAVAALVLAVGERQPGPFSRVGAASRSGPRGRRARPPRAQLRHDLWTAPLARLGGWVCAGTSVLAAAVVLDAAGRLPDLGFILGANVFLVVALQLVLRPFGSDLLMAGLAGRHGAGRGDFLAAFSILPVSRVAVLRGVWLHGAVSSAATWAVVVLAIAVRARLRFGAWGLVDADGDDVSRLAGWALILVPMLAGFLVVAADGRRIATAVSALALVLGLQGMFLVVVAMSALGLGPSAVEAVTILFQAGLLAAGALPAVPSLLRSEP